MDPYKGTNESGSQSWDQLQMNEMKQKHTTGCEGGGAICWYTCQLIAPQLLSLVYRHQKLKPYAQRDPMPRSVGTRATFIHQSEKKWNHHRRCSRFSENLVD